MNVVRVLFWGLATLVLGGEGIAVLWGLLGVMHILPRLPGVRIRPLQAITWTAFFVPCLWVGMEMCAARFLSSLRAVRAE